MNLAAPLNRLSVTIENLHDDLKNATERLLEIARSQSWNSISSNCLFIISEIKDFSHNNLFELRKTRKRENERKKPLPLERIVDELYAGYENIYDINLYIYKSTRELTIVEVKYYPKSSLDKEYFEKVKDNPPMLHSKVALPPYSEDGKSKFDINWELGGFRHNWKMYWWKKKLNRRKTPLSQTTSGKALE